MTDGPVLYGRKFSIVAYKASTGSGIDLSELRCKFVVRQWENATPNNMDLHITNLSKDTAERLQKEFTRVQVSAGYEGLFGIIFDGGIIQARRGRDSPTETYLHIVATDGDTAHNNATMNVTLAAGSKPEDVHAQVCTAFDKQGTGKGYTDPALTGPALPRGRVLFGMARDVLHDLASSTGTVWSIQQGKLQVTSRGGYLPGEAVVINRETGMVGVPTVQPGGIYVRCLMNPLLKVGTLVKLDNNSIQTARMPVDPQGQASFEVTGGGAAKLEGDGTYKVLAVDHFGDTRGPDWYSDIEALGVSQGSTAASAARLRGDMPQPLQTPAPAAKATTTASTGSNVASDPRPLSDGRGDRDSYAGSTVPDYSRGY